MSPDGAGSFGPYGYSIGVFVNAGGSAHVLWNSIKDFIGAGIAVDGGRSRAVIARNSVAFPC